MARAPRAPRRYARDLSWDADGLAAQPRLDDGQRAEIVALLRTASDDALNERPVLRRAISHPPQIVPRLELTFFPRLVADEDIEILIRKLDRRDVIAWQPEMRLGTPVYDALVDRLARSSLSTHQRANALVVLHHLRRCGSDEQVFELVIAALADAQQRVRDQAVHLAIALIAEHSGDERFKSDRAIRALRAAVDAGVRADVARMVADLDRTVSAS